MVTCLRSSGNNWKNVAISALHVFSTQHDFHCSEYFAGDKKMKVLDEASSMYGVQVKCI